MLRHFEQNFLLHDPIVQHHNFIKIINYIFFRVMSSARKREEFMTQFESIVEWVNQTVKKVERKFNSEKEQKAALHAEYSRLIDVQRQYAVALKKLAAERHKFERNDN